MSTMSRILVCVLALVMGTSSWAQEEKLDSGVCPIATAMEKLPQMSYRVGEQEACCPKSAEKLAEKLDLPVHFVVAGKSYEDHGQAMEALAEATEQFVDEFTSPKTCKVSGTTQIAGQSIHCGEKAAHVAKVIEDAVKQVSMTFQVGEEQCHCPTQAKALAEKSGEKMEYVVGETKTCCSIDARIKLARAKYEAAVRALANLEKESTKPVNTKPSEIKSAET